MTEMQPRNETIQLSDYQPHPRNYNRHPAAQVERIAHSLATFGQVRSIVVWRGYLLAGHGVAEAANALGWGELRADVLPDDYPEHLALAYVAADNELSRLSDPDLAQLASILDEAKQTDEELLRAIGYDDKEFEELLREVEADALGDNAGADTEPQIDKAEELRQKWGVETGQLWQLGEHRLICGDCTDAEVVARVMGGEKANGAFTSPPYAMQREQTYGGVPADQYVDWWGAVQSNVRMVIEADASFFVNIKAHCQDGERALYVHDLVLQMVRVWEWAFIDELCWRNLNGMPGKFAPRLRNGFEPIFHFGNQVHIKHRLDNVRREAKPSTVKRYELAKAKELGRGRIHSSTGSGANRDWATLVSQDGVLPDNVIEMGSEPTNVNHPAAFPVGLPEFFMLAYSDEADTWLEPFSGSGTTIIACENLKRRCRAVEISPGYVAVALERWHQHTGKMPTLLE